MCEICDYTEKSKVNVRDYDPTHTLTLRNAFVADVNRRFKHVARLVTKAIVEDDVFGLNENSSLAVMQSSTGKRAYASLTNPAKVQAFLDWLRQVEDIVILEQRLGTQFGALANVPWIGAYIAKAYEQGTERAKQEMRKAGISIVAEDQFGNVIVNPVAVEKLLLLFTRTFTDLREITTTMDAQISRILTMGLLEGKGPIELARTINSMIIADGETLGLDITYISKTGKQVTYFMSGRRRAEILARTEIIRAHHLATIAEYRAWAVEGVYVLAEWATAGDARVCPECASLQGTVWTLDEIENMIPAHPQCRCVSIPFVDLTKTKIGG